MTNDELINYLRSCARRDAEFCNGGFYPPDPPARVEDSPFWQAANAIERGSDE